jgi:D-sedoheptulose 7-phosphate isomerase
MKINFKSCFVKNKKIIDELVLRHARLAFVKETVEQAADALIDCYSRRGKVLICGNGGSSADADHIVGELMKGFENLRPVDDTFKNQLKSVSSERGEYLASKLQQALPAISLTAHQALITAVANDTDADLIFAQQVMGYGSKGDVLIAISTSGNARNVLDAIITARAGGLTVIGITGESGGKMKPFCDVLVNVPESRTAYVQELMLPVFHALCLMVEGHFFGSDS